VAQDLHGPGNLGTMLLPRRCGCRRSDPDRPVPIPFPSAVRAGIGAVPQRSHWPFGRNSAGCGLARPTVAASLRNALPYRGALASPCFLLIGMIKGFA
jgi:hypothetical protein